MGRGNITDTIRKIVQGYFPEKYTVVVKKEEKTQWGETIVTKEDGISFYGKGTFSLKGPERDGLVLQGEEVGILLFPWEIRLKKGDCVKSADETEYTIGKVNHYGTHNECVLKKV